MKEYIVIVYCALRKTGGGEVGGFNVIVLFYIFFGKKKHIVGYWEKGRDTRWRNRDRDMIRDMGQKYTHQNHSYFLLYTCLQLPCKSIPYASLRGSITRGVSVPASQRRLHYQLHFKIRGGCV